MQEVLLLKCGELVLKGLNRSRFEDRLLKIIRSRLKPVGEYIVHSNQSTIYVEPQNDAPVQEAFDICSRIFGIVAMSRAAVCPKNLEEIQKIAGEYLKEQLENVRSFKVMARRSDKRFAYTSPQICAEVGGYLHDMFPHLVPKMDSPDVTVVVEIREQYAFVSGTKMMGAGGMPSGSNGRAMLLLSGGIDSPVAGYMMAKRGLDIAAVHFFSYPYTSEQAKEKVVELARIMGRYVGKITISMVPFTKIQLEIQKKCPEDYFTIIMRRFMMRIGEKTAIHQGCGGLVTGESLGQVASQTMEAMAVTNAVCTLPVFRPVVGMDKEEIVEISRKIGAFTTSILPYEDCCTVFTPKHPQTKPRLAEVEEMEQCMEIDALVQEAFEGIERVTV